MGRSTAALLVLIGTLCWVVAVPSAADQPPDGRMPLLDYSTPSTSSSAPTTEDAGDSYVTRGRRVPLLRATDEIAVQYARDVSCEQGFEVLSSRPGRDSLIQRKRLEPQRVGILGLKGGDPAKSRALQGLVAENIVERTYPVLVCPDDMTRMIATDELLLCLEPGTDIAGIEPALAEISAFVIQREPANDLAVYLVRLTDPDRADALAASTIISGFPGVQWAEPNFIREIRPFMTPDDPMFPQQQALDNSGQNNGLADADVDGPEAWDLSQGSSDIVIAIIDDGVDASHSDLDIAPGGYDFYNSDSDPNPTGSDGHGTGCAGVAAARGNNSYRVSGIAPNCKILPVKIFDGSNVCTDSGIGNAIRYAADRADVISNSWGGGSESTYIDTAIGYALASGRGGKGCPVLFASGNGASGWYRGGGRSRLSTAGLSGSYYFEFYYIKNASVSSGLDQVIIDNVCIIESDGYTHRWQEDFEGTFPPAGWTLQGSANWTQTSANAYTGTGGAYSARSGAITHSQWTGLRTPLQTITGAETLAFAQYVSSQAGGDLLYVRVYDSSSTYIGAWGSWSGVPAITTAVAYPASHANSIAVGTASDRDRRSDYSEYGAGLDFLAPSNGGWNDIATLDPVGAVGWNATDYKYNFGGTSSACPLAAGIAALLVSSNPDLAWDAVRNIMQQTCDKVGGVTYTDGWNSHYGYGRVNAYRALRSLDLVEAHSSPQADLDLPDVNDSEPEKMSVLKFKVTDPGEDSRSTLIDRITVNIAGSAAHASNDIAWAELRDASARVATSSSITDTEIVFGAAPNGDSAAQLDTVTDAGSVEYTVYIYLNASLQGQPGQTYVFDVDETGIDVDGANSSQMAGDSSAVTPVTGTLSLTLLGITVTPDVWALGPQPLGYTGESGTFTVTNTGSVAEDFTVMSSNGANGWNLAGAPGENAFKVEVDLGDDGAYEMVLTTIEQSLASDVAVLDDRTFGLRYGAPTSDTVGDGVTHDFTITLKASLHPAP